MEKITVVIPYNKDRGYLQQAIDSVHSQTLPVKLILQHGDYSCAKNLSDALERVETEYYCVLAEDDFLTPTFAEKFLSKMDVATMWDKELDLVFGDGIHVRDGHMKVYKASYINHEELLKHNTIHGGAVLYRTESVREARGYDEALKLAEEYDLHLRMSKLGMNFEYLEESLYCYRIHDSNKSRRTRENKIERAKLVNEIKEKNR